MRAPTAGDAQYAEPLRSDPEHVSGKDREQSSRPAEQYREQVEGDCAQHKLVFPHISQPLADLSDPRSARLEYRPCVRTNHQGTRRGGCVQPSTHRVANDRRDDAEQSAQGWTQDAGQLGGQRVGRDRPWKQAKRHEHWAQGARRRLKKRPATSEQRSQGEDRPQAAPERRPGCKPHGRQELGHVAEGEDAAAVVSVSSLARDESECEQRQELGQADHPDRKRSLCDGHRPSGDLVDLPGDDDRLRTGGEGAEEASSQEEHVWPAGKQR